MSGIRLPGTNIVLIQNAGIAYLIPGSNIVYVPGTTISGHLIPGTNFVNMPNSHGTPTIPSISISNNKNGTPGVNSKL